LIFSVDSHNTYELTSPTESENGKISISRKSHWLCFAVTRWIRTNNWCGMERIYSAKIDEAIIFSSSQ